MLKRIALAVLALIIVAGALAGTKALQIQQMIKTGEQFVPPPESVTTVEARQESWEETLPSVGSLVAVQGVIVTAELNGKVVHIAFEPGSMAQAGDLLIQQDTSREEADLAAAETTVALAKINLDRARDLLVTKAISQSEEDDTNAKYEQAKAQSESIRTSIAKKAVRAPFAGRLGIRLVNLGEFLKEGDEIVSLQTLDPIFVNFWLPQQQLAEVELGLTARLTTDAAPGKVIEGKITAINPQVDASTRNVKVQATVANPDESLRPGMFVNVAVVLPKKNDVILVPATAVLFAPYSDSVFIVEDANSANEDAPGNTDTEQMADQSAESDETPAGGKVVRQQLVQLGEARGDYVSVLSGLQGGETIVSTGVFKLRNGQAIVVNNDLQPDFKLNPTPDEK